MPKKEYNKSIIILFFILDLRYYSEHALQSSGNRNYNIGDSTLKIAFKANT